MEENKSLINSFMSRLLAAYGACVVVFCIMIYFIGETAKGYSPLFSLGKGGLSLATLLELLILSLFIVVAQDVFLTDRWIKNMGIILRKLIFFVSIMLVMVGMTVIFKWFPLNDINAWLGFIISYTCCMGISTFITRSKEISENTKMQEALERFKEK